MEGTGLYAYGFRYYDPVIGRWTGVDALADHPNQIDKSPYAYAWNNPISLTDPDGNCPWCFGAILGGGLELVTQIGVNYATGNDLLDIDYFDVAQSTLTGGLTGGLSVLNATAKTTKLAATALLVTDELSKAGTDIKFGKDGIEVSSVANGGKEPLDAITEFGVGVAGGKATEFVGGVAGDLLNTGLQKEASAATRQVRRTRSGSANNVAAQQQVARTSSTMQANQNKANSVSSFGGDLVKEPLVNDTKQSLRDYRAIKQE
jgi:RHS repeat-associated protein